MAILSERRSWVRRWRPGWALFLLLAGLLLPVGVGAVVAGVGEWQVGPYVLFAQVSMRPDISFGPGAQVREVNPWCGNWGGPRGGRYSRRSLVKVCSVRVGDWSYVTAWFAGERAPRRD